VPIVFTASAAIATAATATAATATATDLRRTEAAFRASELLERYIFGNIFLFRFNLQMRRLIVFMIRSTDQHTGG